jgi:hypothetical protein
LGRWGDFKVEVDLGVDADWLVVDEEWLVAVRFDGGEGCALEQRWAADDCDAVYGAGFGDGDVEDDEALNTGDVGDDRILWLVAGDSHVTGLFGGEGGDLVGGG